jgi:hypothetical protein
MSVVAQSMKRPWLAFGIGGLLILALAGGLVLANLPGRHLLSDGQGSTDGSIGAPEFVQPKWRIESYPAGATGKITKAERSALAKQRVQLSGVVTSVYDALFLEPGDLEKAVRSSFDKGAADVMLRTHAGLTRDAADVRITRRVARIGIQPEGARRAAAKVKVIARAEVDGREIDIKHQSILWLQRGADGWRVIGFDVRQAPVHKSNAGDRPARHKSKGTHPKGKKHQ